MGTTATTHIMGSSSSKHVQLWRILIGVDDGPCHKRVIYVNCTSLFSYSSFGLLYYTFTQPHLTNFSKLNVKNHNYEILLHLFQYAFLKYQPLVIFIKLQILVIIIKGPMSF